MDEYSLKELVAAANTYEAERNAWMQAYHELSAQAEEFKNSMQKQISELKDSIELERKAWNKALRKAKGPGLGPFAGVAYTSNGNFEGVVGFGFVFPVVR